MKLEKKPDAPRFLQSSKRSEYIGRSLAEIMLQDPAYVQALADNACNQSLRKHAEWLLGAGDNRVGPLCSGCGVVVANWVAIHRVSPLDTSGDFSIIPGAYCSECAPIQGNVRVPLRFSSASNFSTEKSIRCALLRHLRAVFGLGDEPDAEEAFRFFRAPGWGEREEKQMDLLL